MSQKISRVHVQIGDVDSERFGRVRDAQSRLAVLVRLERWVASAGDDTTRLGVGVDVGVLANNCCRGRLRFVERRFVAVLFWYVLCLVF